MTARPRKCKTCGCTWETPCSTKFGPCFWVARAACSACRPDLVAHLLTRAKKRKRSRKGPAKDRLVKHAKRLARELVRKGPR